MIGLTISEMQKRRQVGLCPFCGEEVKRHDFRDTLSHREFRISGLCQKCQDQFFGRCVPIED